MRCYDTPPGRANRSATTVKIASRNWLSQALATHVAQIVMQEFLGYTVELVKPSATPLRWQDSIVSGEFDLELEHWQLHPVKSEYKRYIVNERLADALPLGYVGRAALFVNKRLQEVAPMSDSYRFWQNPSLFPSADVIRYPELNLSAWSGDGFPMCKPADYSFCGEGGLEGYWTPERCRARPEDCAMVVHAMPSWDTAYFEQLVNNHNMYALFAYLGGSSWNTYVQDRVRQGRNVIFYGWEPDPLVVSVGAQRVSFPDYVFGCLEGFTLNPSGALTCDYQETTLKKLLRRSLRLEAPEAWYSAARLQISQQDMNFMLGLSVEGGGNMSAFGAACALVKANEVKILAEVAPPCVSAPLSNPQTGDLIFDPRLVECTTSVTYPELPKPPMCLNSTKGTVDRTHLVVKVAQRDWLSHQLSSAVAEILLREYLHYDVRMVNASGADPTRWGPDISANAFDVDIESRFAADGSAAQIKYETELGIVSAPTPVGYSLRSAVFVLAHSQAKTPFADFWRLYENAQRPGTDFYTFADVDLRALLGVDFPVCKQSAHAWCGTGATEGWYVPPVCQTNPGNCAIVFAASPEQDTGYFEQLTKNLGLHLVHAYLGIEGLKQFVQQAHRSATKDLLFQWYDPDSFTTSVGAVRVSYPDYSFGCDLGNTQDPSSGTVSCDYGPVQLNKVALATLASDVPEAAFLINRFTLLAEDMQYMIKQHEESGGSLDTHSAACQFVQANAAKLEADIVPDCITKPKTLADIRVGDLIFKPSEGVCVEVSCQPTEILLVLGDSVVCQSCPQDRLPNADQTRCDTCPAGSSPMLQASGMLECTCNAGARQIIVDGKTTCELCPRGKHAILPVNATSCDNCTAGRHSPTAGSTQCLNCTAGRSIGYEGASHCVLCKQGFFQDVEGGRSCSFCGRGLVTQVLGADSADQCVCDEDFYREDPSAPCLQCPEGMKCALGSDMSNLRTWQANGQPPEDLPPFPVTLVGYMSLADAPLSVYECDAVERCPGGPPGTCGPDIDTKSRSCSVCGDSLYWDGQKCSPCHSQAWLFPWIPSLMGPPVVAFMYKISRDEADRWGSWQNCAAAMSFLLLNHYQITSVVAEANVRFPTTLANVFKIYTIAEDPLALFNPRCAGVRSFYDNVLLRAAVPLILLFVVLLTHFGSHIFALVIQRGTEGFNRDRSANVYFSFIFTFFVGICSMALTTFKCAENPNGKATLIADRGIHCYDGEWMGAVAISVVAILYLFGFGGLFLWAVWTAPKRFAEQTFRRRWKFLFIKFRPGVWWWALLFCSKSMLMNVGFMFIQVGIFQAYWVMGVLTLYVSAAVCCLPWRHAATTLLDIYRCFALNIVISLLISSTTGVAIEGLDSTVTTAVLAVNISPVLVASLLFAWAVYLQVSPSARQDTEGQIRGLFNSMKLFTATPEDQMVRLLQQLDEWGRWHVVSTMQVVGAELAGVEALKKRRLTDGSIHKTFYTPAKPHSDHIKEGLEVADEPPHPGAPVAWGEHSYFPEPNISHQLSTTSADTLPSFDGLHLPGCKALGRPK